ncbi:MAG: NlpC/P60 family protein [Sphingomonas sp.]
MLAPHYARALVRGCGARSAFIRAAEGEAAPAVCELLPGEDFAVLEYAGGWAWGYRLEDSLVGYVEAIALADRIDPTHVVCETSAPVSPDDRVTAPLLASLPMGALLQGEECGACLTTEYGCVSLAHLRRIDDREQDPVVAAERLLGAPYRAGGRTVAGIDAGGLVQLALGLCGLAVPRLPDLLAAIGEPARDQARRGDLVVAGDVIGLMVDDLMMIHAAGEAGKVSVEPVALFPGAERRRLSL